MNAKKMKEIEQRRKAKAEKESQKKAEEQLYASKPTATEKLQIKQRQQELERRQQREMEKIRAKRNKIASLEQKQAMYEKQLEELAAQYAPKNVSRDANSLYKPTIAQQKRREEVEQARKNGEKSGNKISVGFDPFALNPMGM